MWPSILLAALLINGFTLSKVGDALAESMRNDEPEPPAMEFELIEEPELPFAEADRLGNQLPSAEELREADSKPARETPAPARAERSSSAPGESEQEPLGEPPPDPADSQDPGEPGGEENLHEAPDGKLGLAGLGGSSDALRAAFGGHASHAAPSDADEAETSVILAKRNLYGSFFNRLHDRIAEEWKPERANQAADPNQTIYGTSARTTVLWLQLDELGAVTKIVVKRSCGAAHLDDEAVRAINAAAPFPNPPKDLVDSDGHIEFDFGFTLDFIEGGRIFRQRR